MGMFYFFFKFWFILKNYLNCVENILENLNLNLFNFTVFDTYYKIF